MKITALCIVKNEEANIATSINSYKDAVDEIIIVDTGSTDDTIKICEDLGCKVLNYEWINDFSDARNFALKQVNEGWILFLDADEYFEAPLNDSFRDAINELENENVNVAKLLTYNIDKKNYDKLNTIYGLKLFKYNEYVKYKRPIHEYLDLKGIETVGILIDEFPLIHTGYSSEIALEKPKRNLEILIENDNKGLSTTKDYFYLTRECLSLSRTEEAKKYMNCFFNSEDYLEEIKGMDIGYMIYTYKYIIMCSDNSSYEEKVDYLESVIKDYDIPDFYYYLALLYMTTDYKLAYDYFFKAIESDNGLRGLDVFSNFCNYVADIYYNMAKIQYVLKDDVLSFRHATVACMLNRRSGKYLDLLLKVSYKKSDKKIADVLYKVYKPETTGEYEFLVAHLVNTNLHNVFKSFAIEYNTEYNGSNTAVFMAMLLDSQAELSATTSYNLYVQTQNDYYQFITVVSLLYKNTVKLYNTYYDKLTENYRNIIDYFRGKADKLSEENYHIFMDILIRLMYLGDRKCLNKIDYDKISEDELVRVFIALDNINDYKTVGKLFDNHKFSKEMIVSRYLLSLYMRNKKPEMKVSYNKFMQDIDLSNYRYLLNL